MANVLERANAEVAVTAWPDGRVPMFRARLNGGGRRGVYLYQRDDGAWYPVYPRDGRAITEPGVSAMPDLPESVAALYPEITVSP